MKLRKVIIGALIACLIFILALPLAFLITVLSFPFWRWLESLTGIESFGHSGPAAWCYWLIYSVLVLCAGVAYRYTGVGKK